MRAVGFERGAAVDDRHALPAFDLVDGAIIPDEETALGDVPFGRRRGEGRRQARLLAAAAGVTALLGQPVDGGRRAARQARRCRGR